MSLRITRRHFALTSAAAAGASLLGSSLPAAARRYEPVIPGTGIRVARTGDNFENEEWTYYPQHPKSSWNIDENVRIPGSISKNSLWAEGAKRGTPDHVRRVPTPPGGIEGSTGSILIQTLHSGIPGDLSYQQQQDDLLHNTQAMVGGTIPVSWSPNCICRVYVAPIDRWERRNGASFGYRIGLLGWAPKSNNEEYWPGIFFHMERNQKEKQVVHEVRAWIRADEYGRDMPSLTFAPEEWMTLGMSCTPDGACHFYARKGIDDLQAEDCVGSYMCYNYRAHSFQTFFYNVINQDDGRSVSTPWIIDDAVLYAATPPRDKIRVPKEQTAATPPQPPADETEKR